MWIANAEEEIWQEVGEGNYISGCGAWFPWFPWLFNRRYGRHCRVAFPGNAEMNQKKGPVKSENSLCALQRC